MADTYFEYALSQCKMHTISSVCHIEKTKEALMNRANKTFCGCDNVTADWRLLQAVSFYSQDVDVINPCRLNHDALTVYRRCQRGILGKDKIGYDEFFEYLTDLLWVLGSIEKQAESQRQIKLLSNFAELKDSIRSYLLDLYNSAVRDSNECVYINEAKQAKKKIFPHHYDFVYEESKKYIVTDNEFRPIYLSSDLDNIEDDYKRSSISKMSLFYGLTATAALAENIRRFN